MTEPKCNNGVINTVCEALCAERSDYFYSILRTSGMAHFQASFPSLISVLLQLEKQFYLHTPAGASAAPRISV